MRGGEVSNCEAYSTYGEQLDTEDNEADRNIHRAHKS